MKNDPSRLLVLLVCSLIPACMAQEAGQFPPGAVAGLVLFVCAVGALSMCYKGCQQMENDRKERERQASNARQQAREREVARQREQERQRVAAAERQRLARQDQERKEALLEAAPAIEQEEEDTVVSTTTEEQSLMWTPYHSKSDADDIDVYDADTAAAEANTSAVHSARSNTHSSPYYSNRSPRSRPRSPWSNTHSPRYNSNRSPRSPRNRTSDSCAQCGAKAKKRIITTTGIVVLLCRECASSLHVVKRDDNNDMTPKDLESGTMRAAIPIPLVQANAGIFTREEVSTWSIDLLVEQLIEHDLGSYESCIRQHALSGRELVEVVESDLFEALCVTKLGDKVKFRRLFRTACAW